MDVLPPSRPREWDHAVIAVHDLDAAAETFESLGFTLTAKAEHPFGTANRLALLQRTYIELIAVERPDRIEAPSADNFGFAAFVARYLRHREGLAMMALKIEDADAEARRYVDEGLVAFPPGRFSRKADMPDGREETVSFVTAHALDPRLPELALFGCQHEAADAVWAAGSQSHANGARDITGAIVLDENPTDHHIFYASMLGLRDMHASSAGIRLSMERGELDIMPSTAYSARYGRPVMPLSTPGLAALRIRADRSRIVPAEDACGVMLIFEETDE